MRKKMQRVLRRRLRSGGRQLLPTLTLLGATGVLAGCSVLSEVGVYTGTDIRHAVLLRRPPPRQLPVPVDGVPRHALRDSFGDPRSGGRRHEGIDIFARRNTPVRSTTEGIVSQVGNNGLGGRTVSVTGPGGYRHYYAHLESWARISEGQWVEAGTILGYVGNSGNARSTSPHLHYGLFSDRGVAVNPYPLLKSGPGPFQLASGRSDGDRRLPRRGATPELLRLS